MSIRTLILGTVVVCVLSLGGFLAFQVRGAIEDGFQAYRSRQIPKLREYVSAVINSKEEKLQGILGVITHNAKFDVEDLRTKAGVAFVGEITQLKSASPSLPRNVVETALTAKDSTSTFSLGEWQGAPVFFGYKKVGVRIFVAGYPIDSNFSNRLSHLTSSQISFELLPRGEHSESAYVVRSYGAKDLTVKIEPERTLFAALSKTLIRELFIATALSLVASFVLLYLILSQLFLKRFRKNLELIRTASDQLHRGEYPKIELLPGITQEEKWLHSSFQSMVDGLKTYDSMLHYEIKEKLKLSQKIAMGELIEQVAHDIRSPLSSLEMLIVGIRNIPAERRALLKGCFERIKDAVAQIRENRMGNGNLDVNPQKERLLPIIQAIVTEKKLQYKASGAPRIRLATEKEAVDAIALIKRREFERALSNLLDNAIEACTLNDKVDVLLSLDESRVRIEISDTGRGIPESVMEAIGKKGFTHGKADGLGLGLHHAMSTFASFNGSLQISSEEGRGTVVTIEIPLAAAETTGNGPILDLSGIKTIIVVDDEEVIHRFWREKLKKAVNGDVQVLHLYSPEELTEWSKTERSALKEGCMILCDQEFGRSEKGADCLVRLELQTFSVLITSAALDPDLRTFCAKMGLRLLDKAILPKLKVVGRLRRQIRKSA